MVDTQTDTFLGQVYGYVHWITSLASEGDLLPDRCDFSACLSQYNTTSNAKFEQQCSPETARAVSALFEVSLQCGREDDTK